jgi:flagellar M-ring protein FliF
MRQPAIVRSMPIIVVSMIVLVGLGTIFMMREPAMTQLFPRLGDEDKSLVLQNLETNGIKAKLDPTTGTLMVPRNDFHRARMSLAAAGLPKAAIAGYDIISQMPLGASRAVETVKLKQAATKKSKAPQSAPSSGGDPFARAFSKAERQIGQR